MPKITVFTTNTCGYCGMIKSYLKHRNVTYKEINITEDPKKRQEVFELSGAMTVPVTLIEKDNEKQVVVGYNLAKLAPLLS